MKTMNTLPTEVKQQAHTFTLLERYENYALFKVTNGIGKVFYSTANIHDENLILGFSSDVAGCDKYEVIKAVFDAEVQKVKDTRLIQVAEAERQKELERIESVRLKKIADAKELRNADITEVKKLITGAKDFKAVMKDNKISNLLTEIIKTDLLITLI